jgi:hypothetical protein
MKRFCLTALLAALTLGGFAQNGEDERQYYLDISVGMNIPIAPFSSSSNSQYMLKPYTGSSMSFSFGRRVSDSWGIQMEVLSAVFKVKNSDLLSYYASASSKPTQLDLKGYSSTFFGIGGVNYLRLGASRFNLDLKGSIGFTMNEYAKQKFVILQNGANNTQNYTISAKRAYGPALLAGARLRYPVGDAIDLGLKVEYGISRASFDPKQSTTSSGNTANVTSVDLASQSKTLSFLNTGITLGLRF